MTLPKYSEMVNAILKILSDGNPKPNEEILKNLKTVFKPTVEELNERVQSGTPKFNHRMGWAIFDLTKAKVVERVSRAVYKISTRGVKFLSEKPDFVFEDLYEFPEFVEFRKGKMKKSKSITKSQESANFPEDTPEENVEEQIKILTDKIKQEVLEKLKSCPPSKFEWICLKLIVEMGYGGSYEEAAFQLLGKSHDEGVDGVIKMDKLGLENVYIQAKRWNSNSVGREKVQQFSGAIEGKATKGIMMTTSHFTREATNYAMQPGAKTIILIDGERMAELMIGYDLGVSTVKEYKISKIDKDFFEDDEEGV